MVLLQHVSVHEEEAIIRLIKYQTKINPLSPELNPICYLLALL